MAADDSLCGLKDISKIEPLAFISYVSVLLSIDKLDGCNYDTWASDIKL